MESGVESGVSESIEVRIAKTAVFVQVVTPSCSGS
jgi:hypothetical protein